LQKNFSILKKEGSGAGFSRKKKLKKNFKNKKIFLIEKSKKFIF